MKSLVRCARCHKAPDVVPISERGTWQSSSSTGPARIKSPQKVRREKCKYLNCGGLAKSAGFCPKHAHHQSDVTPAAFASSLRDGMVSPTKRTQPSKAKPSIFDKLTNPKYFTGIHKHRKHQLPEEQIQESTSSLQNTVFEEIDRAKSVENNENHDSFFEARLLASDINGDDRIEQYEEELPSSLNTRKIESDVSNLESTLSRLMASPAVGQSSPIKPGFFSSQHSFSPVKRPVRNAPIKPITPPPAPMSAKPSPPPLPSATITEPEAEANSLFSPLKTQPSKFSSPSIYRPNRAPPRTPDTKQIPNNQHFNEPKNETTSIDNTVSDEPLPAGWMKTIDPVTAEAVYFNIKTCKMSWKRPSLPA
eukprot:TRINITY_DN2751_c0_g1_i1.p1 TRINITY_DN2751_c0_g1~~TRINITY_DN2751_c0_g1_i1.p1  ORF type:complete len:384 (-),score=119.79 TRINITY_DN2751_c0_g1_i1:339-1430(-)